MTGMLAMVAGGGLALAVAWGVCATLPRFSALSGVVDLPNSRSLHDRPVVRTGGLAILAGIAVGGAWGALWVDVGWGAVAVIAGAAALAAVSFADDVVGVSVGTRLGVQIISAVLAVGGTTLHTLRFGEWTLVLPVEVGYVIAILWVVWMTNLYNFMDGMDGFAGGMAVVGFGTLALIGAWQGHVAFTMVSIVTAGAAAGFLWHNFPPARIFMGDVGSSTLGYLAGVMVLWGRELELFPIWVGLLVFSPFVVDATVTLLRRALSGERIWTAHRSHYYQRVVCAGWGHRKTVLAEYALMVGCSGAALSAVALRPIWDLWIGLGAAAFYLLLGMAVRRLERVHRRENWMRGPG